MNLLTCDDKKPLANMVLVEKYRSAWVSWNYGIKSDNVESGMIIVVWLNFFGEKTMSAGLYNLDLKNSYLSSMTFSKHLKTSWK